MSQFSASDIREHNLDFLFSFSILQRIQKRKFCLVYIIYIINQNKERK